MSGWGLTAPAMSSGVTGCAEQPVGLIITALMCRPAAGRRPGGGGPGGGGEGAAVVVVAGSAHSLALVAGLSVLFEFGRKVHIALARAGSGTGDQAVRRWRQTTADAGRERARGQRSIPRCGGRRRTRWVLWQACHVSRPACAASQADNVAFLKNQ